MKVLRNKQMDVTPMQTDPEYKNCGFQKFACVCECNIRRMDEQIEYKNKILKIELRMIL